MTDNLFFGREKLMREIRIFCVLLLILGFGSKSEAQLFEATSKVGTTVAQFLKIGAGARATALGGAYTAVSDDIYSVYWNPAGIATSSSQFQLTFNHAEWLADMSYDYAAGAINLGEFGTLFASLTNFQVPEEKVRTEESPEGDGRVWDAGSIALAVGFSKMLTDRFSIGMTVKYIREAIWNSSSSGFAVDFGTLYRTPFNDLMIGAAISNFGSKMQLDGRDIYFNTDPNDNGDTGPNNIPSNYRMEEFDIPLTFRVGLSMPVIQTRFIKVLAAVDATHPNDNTEYVNSGLEIAYDDMFFIRGGYRSLFKRNSEEDFTFGAGIKYGFTDNLRVVINYGYADFGRLKDVQFFDIGLIF
ncbi:MAG: PorV/PorQ family protein [Ignavibacteriales bacterium]|nr:PorV/PorQ family protein [Ignavibacteriales bacterium]MCF8435723.1 PorV/PorQ family protein [Ignavibacteriales bacterium]